MAQNLVPNPGFENYINCPVRPGDIPRFNIPGQTVTVTNWINPAYTTPDYFNACALPASNVGVPVNYAGTHSANTGNAYTGLVLYFRQLMFPPGVDLRYEYLQVKLTAPLQADSLYDVSCYVKLPSRRKSVASNISHAINSVNASLSATPPQSTTGYIHIPGALQLKKPGKNYITDSTEWGLIYGTYKAIGNEEWLTIGILDTAVLQLEKIQEENPNVPATQFSSYYLIDDIVVAIHQPCDTTFNIIDTNLCINGKLPATLFSNAPNGYKRKWNTGDTAQRIVITTPGVYWCTATANLCNLYVDTYIVAYDIDTNRRPVTDVILCDGDTRTLSAATPGKAYLWNTGETTRDINITQGGTYTCYITVENCDIAAEEFQVNTTIPPSSYVQPIKDTTVCNMVVIGESYSRGENFKWNTGDTTCCIMISKTGIYTVTISTDGCPAYTDSVAATVINCENCISVPSAFTPNADGLNDYFRVLPSCPINTFTFRIYNRWGQEVFYTTDVNKGWNGMHGADIADVGTYFYLIEYTSVKAAKSELLKGDVLLLR